MGSLTVTRQAVLPLAGASLGVAFWLAGVLPDPCRSVTPDADLTQVGGTWRDRSGQVQLWIDRDSRAFDRLACAD